MKFSEINSPSDLVLFNETTTGRENAAGTGELSFDDIVPQVVKLSAADALKLAKLIVAAQQEWHEEMAQDPDNGEGWSRDAMALKMAAEVLDVVDL